MKIALEFNYEYEYKKLERKVVEGNSAEVKELTVKKRLSLGSVMAPIVLKKLEAGALKAKDLKGTNQRRNEVKLKLNVGGMRELIAQTEKQTEHTEVTITIEVEELLPC